MARFELPKRYLPLSRLGKGGGGEVWAVRDRHGEKSLALKVLAEGASEREMAALVREAVALSGLEGLGVPRVVRFGRLPGSGRPFMVRELVEGQSLGDLIDGGLDVERTLDALARSAEQLTLVHRAGLLHGDIKPANIIVEESGRATLVDLGLAAPWRETGTAAEGLTPRYAAPELMAGGPLTVRAEVYALGVALAEAIEHAKSLKKEVVARLESVVERATHDDPSRRHPSADEFASELRHAALLGPPEHASNAAAIWPVVGIDGAASQLLTAIDRLTPGAVLRLAGPRGSGQSALMRRSAWSLGVRGTPVAWIDEGIAGSVAAVVAELQDQAADGLIVLVDDAGRLTPEGLAAVKRAGQAGARLVVAGSAELGAAEATFEVPPLDKPAAIDLVRRAVPSLTDSMIERIVSACGCRPGELRRVVGVIASQAVASSADIERVLSEEPEFGEALPRDALERAQFFLDRGRYDDARTALDAVRDADPLTMAVARARLSVGLGEAKQALEVLEGARAEAEAQPDSASGKAWRLYLVRAHVGLAEYAKVLELVEAITDDESPLGVEALAFKGSALSFLGRHDEARELLTRAVVRARELVSPRAESVALTCLGFALQRHDRMDEARKFYEEGLVAGEKAGDAGMLATLRLNLAGLLKMRGDIAGAIQHFEGAVDMGKRSGRRSTTRQALLNLANTDLYLGRLARARASIDALTEQRDQLPPVMQAQLHGLIAELRSLSGQSEAAVRDYEASAAAYVALGRGMDAAEALLEAVLLATRSGTQPVSELREWLARAERELGQTPAHRPLAKLAQGRVAMLAEDEAGARDAFDQALAASREAGQREWSWRALAARAELEEAAGQSMNARRDREEALALLEDIGARLPRDLREVYWNDPRRRELRSLVQRELAVAVTAHATATKLAAHIGRISQLSPISSHASTPLERRLARILEVNSELVGELDLERLTARVTGYAIELTRAERGYVILQETDGTLTVHSSRSRVGDEPHAEFSRSIAESVIAKGEPMVSTAAGDDKRMKGFASVHQLQLQSVACVPILAPSGRPIGALYVETRSRPASNFEEELPTLRAFADQVAIAIETARLVNENRDRADDLALTNRELEEAQGRLRELLGDRTHKLKEARRKLRSARDTLYSHFGYHGLVGTSSAMRRVYALVDRIRDTDVPILITGESGTGKEVVARAVHEASPRNKAQFMGVNCGAIPEHLLESELFGHVKGAFTGADRERKGLFREADGGSVLLDEIGEMPQKMQAGLLRVLQERKVRPVGGASEESVDARFIFATNRDLDQMVKAGSFREDLYYRIHVVELHLPALRERAEDIPQLVDHFLGLFSARYKRDKGTLSRDAMRRLMAYDWPGNVRQLEHVLLNAWVLSDRSELLPDDFDVPDGRVFSPRTESSHHSPTGDSRTTATTTNRLPRSSQRRPAKSTLSQHRSDERDKILKALQACNWNRVKAAELSGIPRRTFYRRLKDYGIQ
ncbi:MAG: sigma 54-interacting transcriptional regulator [Myxococcales bacterium]|nr:sigma 54-interacting transcriptional regulator [Myxococcales bacterium]